MERLYVPARLLVVLILALALGGATAWGLAAAPSSDTSSDVVALQQGYDDDDDDDNGTDDDDDSTPDDTDDDDGDSTPDDTTPDDTSQSGGAATTDGRPAHIHQGTCAELDPNPAFPLNDVVADDDSDDDEVELSETEVHVSVDDLLAAPHAINIHASAEDADTYVACGNITGQAADLDDDDDDDAKLIVGLAEQNDSGLVGVAILDDDDDDGSTDVQVFLTPAGDGTTPDSTPDTDG